MLEVSNKYISQKRWKRKTKIGFDFDSSSNVSKVIIENVSVLIIALPIVRRMCVHE